MKKKNRRTLEIVFWSVVAIAIAWMVFAPSDKHHTKTHQIAVVPLAPAPVPPEHPEPPAKSAMGGDEQSQVSPSEPVPEPVQPQPIPPPKISGPARIAIVIDDVGLDMSGSRRAVSLPPFVTLSYMPYASRLNEQTRAAREAGHELLLHMPMEPMGSADPGPDALLESQSPDEMRERLDTALASFTGFDGMNNHMGSKLTANTEDMNLVMTELKPRHLFFLDSRTSAQSVGYKVAREQGVPTISRDVFLDDDMSAKAVEEQIDATERVARRKGYAVAIGHPHAVTLAALEAWIPQAEKRGFTFVPLNTLVQGR